MKNNLEKYKDYRRIFPKIRLSWTLYTKYIKGDWIGMWEYLTGFEHLKSYAQEKGTRIHKLIEKDGYKVIKNWQKLGEIKDLEYEKPIIKEYEGYDIVGVVDMINKDALWDWKTGKITGYEKQMQEYMWLEKRPTSYLVELKEIKDEVYIKRVMEYRYSEAQGEYFETMFETMYQDIMKNLKELDKFLNY